MNSLDLFAGAGGASLGLRAAGFTHVACVERDPAACATLRAAGFPAVEADVRRVDYAPYVGVDLVWGSPPCQPWSAAQTRGPRGEADVERNGWPWTLDVIKQVRPRAFLGENVGRAEEHVTHVVAPLLRAWFRFVVVLRVDAADYGLAQHRVRVLVVAANEPFDFHPLRARRAPPESLLGALPGLLAPSSEVHYAEGTGRAASEPWRLTLPAPTVMTTEVKGTRASAKSGWTFHGGPDRASDAAFLAVGRRRLTWRECATLQDFPENYPFRGTVEDRYCQIGNAVPPRLATLAAEIVRPGLAG